MNVDKRFIDRATDLVCEGEHLVRRFDQAVGNANAVSRLMDEQEGWFASVENILQAIFPDPSSPFRRRQTSARAAVSLLNAAICDIEAGVVISVQEAATAEAFDNFLDHAQHYLNGNKVPEAGVIAGVVFEDTVRRLATKYNAIAGGQAGQPLDQVISALEKARVLLPIKVKRCRAAAHVRNKATHAQWGEFERSDVEETIKITRELIESRLDGTGAA